MWWAHTEPFSTFTYQQTSRARQAGRRDVPQSWRSTEEAGAVGQGSTINRIRNSTVVRLARHGLVVIAVDYRLASPSYPSWPHVIEDLREAVRWTRRHASELEIEPDRIAALGQSSGAHLAALLGTLPDEPGIDGVSSRVQAVVSLYGPTDLEHLMEARHLKHEPARILLGTATPTSAFAASPIHHVTTDDAPMLLLHGSDDAWVRPEQSSRMAETLERAGVPHRLIVVDGARHGFEAMVKEPVERDLLPEILAFLKRYGIFPSVAQKPVAPIIGTRWQLH